MNSNKLVKIFETEYIMDNISKQYKFSFLYQKILLYKLKEEDINVKDTLFDNTLKCMHDFSMRVISRSFSMYINNKFRNQKFYNSFTHFYNHYKESFNYNLYYFLDFHNFFSDISDILLNQYELYINSYKRVVNILNVHQKTISSFFNIKVDDFNLWNIDLSEGDLHKDGKGTTSFFVNNTKFFLKWKNFQLDQKHQDLYFYFKDQVHDENKQNIAPILSFDDFFIQKEVISSEIENPHSYFYNAGIFLFVTYLISGTDFHYENIISKRNDILTIDSESLFEIKSNFNVFDTALLPSFSIREKTLAGFSNNFNGSLDIKNIYFYYDDEGMKQKEYIVSKEKLELNTPYYKGNVLNYFTYKEKIIDGFKDAYEHYLKNCSSVNQYIIESFNGLSHRSIKKHTYIYSDAIWSSYTPKLLTGTEKRSNFFRMLDIFDEDEIKFLNCGSIPLFNKKISINNKYFEKFSKDDLNNQISYIEEAYNLEERRYSEIMDSTSFNYNEQVFNNLYDLYVHTLDSAIKLNDGTMQWLEVIEKGNNLYKDYQIEEMPNTIYYGLSGMYLYLYSFSKIIKEDEALKPYIEKFINSYYNEIVKNPAIQNGLLDGASSLLLLMLEINRFSRKYTNEIINIIKFLVTNIKYDISFDFTSGSAGLLKLVLKVYREENFKEYQSEIKEYISVIQNFLVTNFEQNQNECGWNYKNENIYYLGYAHGIIGIIPPLYDSMLITENKKDLYLIDKCVYHVIKNQSQHSGNWPTNEKEKKELYNWCHGGPGILLGLTELYNLGYRKYDIKNIIISTLPRVLCYHKKNISLCHGKFGNNFIGLYISNSLNLKNSFEDILIKDISKYITKKKKHLLNKSFMTGYSGVIYLYIKLIFNNYK
ncbi:DUF4135 domain-containing protein [Staphylococcus pseudintermedius]|uniref:lanthionine synthetase LanC family protein n=1 Tax=Staphylococcus pseudintermedius TaxID=283734 RepID=UPI002ED85578